MNADSAGSAARFDELRFSVAPEAIGGEAAEIVIEGVRLTLTSAGFQTVIAELSRQVSTLSHERIDALLTAMDENPRLRPVRWYYASLLRVAGVRDELAIGGDLFDGGLEIRARFAQTESGNLLRQLRDRARNLVTVAARLHLAAVDGSLQIRMDLTPDVNGLLTNLLLNRMGTQPGLTRVDATTVRIDLVEMVAIAAADRQPRPRLVGRLLDVQITPEHAVFILG
jgi:hypothetical protein